MNTKYDGGALWTLFASKQILSGAGTICYPGRNIDIYINHQKTLKGLINAKVTKS